MSQTCNSNSSIVSISVVARPAAWFCFGHWSPHLQYAPLVSPHDTNQLKNTIATRTLWPSAKIQRSTEYGQYAFDTAWKTCRDRITNISIGANFRFNRSLHYDWKCLELGHLEIQQHISSQISPMRKRLWSCLSKRASWPWPRRHTESKYLALDGTNTHLCSILQCK